MKIKFCVDDHVPGTCTGTLKMMLNLTVQSTCSADHSISHFCFKNELTLIMNLSIYMYYFIFPIYRSCTSVTGCSSFCLLFLRTCDNADLVHALL